MLQVEVDVLKEEMTWNERSTEKAHWERARMIKLTTFNKVDHPNLIGY